MQTYQGGCHCQNVRYEVTMDLSQLITCNCSMCSKKGTILGFVQEPQFKLLKGQDAVTDYLFHKKVLHHTFCKTCGVTPFIKGAKPDGTKMVAINVRCLDNVNIDQLKPAAVNGKEFSATMKNQTFPKRLSYALNGIKVAFRDEASFRFQSCAALGIVAILLFAHASVFWWAINLLTLGAVLTAEMINTALERILDRLHPERHETIGLAKDCAAGAVLIASLVSLGIFAAFVWDTWLK